MIQKTLLIGNWGAGNIGDEMILCAAVEAHPKATVMTNDAESSQKFCERAFDTVPFFPTGLRSMVRFVLSAEYRRQLGMIYQNTDTVIFAGGGLFAIKWEAYVLWSIIHLWARLWCGAKTVRWEHQGIDTTDNDFLAFLAKHVLRNADTVTVRDVPSKHVATVYGVQGVQDAKDRVEAWLMTAGWKQKTKPKHKTCVVNARAMVHSHEWKQVQAWGSERGVTEYVFLACAPEDMACIPNGFEGKIMLPRTKKQVKEVFENANIVVGERLHCLILADGVQGLSDIYTLRAPYSQKVEHWCAKKKIGILPTKKKDKSV